MAFANANTFVHPDIDRFNHLVKCQDELKSMRALVMSVGKDYRIEKGGVFDRYDSARMIREGLEGKNALTAAFKERMRIIVQSEFAAKHRFRCRGVELAAERKPMDKTNFLADTIKEAVEVAEREELPVVSQDVYGQLDADQRQLLERVDGMHQYAQHAGARVTPRNPTGLWPVGEGGSGVTVSPKPGVCFTLHMRSRTHKVELKHVVRGAVTVDIGSEVVDFYGLRSGKYRFSVQGAEYLGPCTGKGMKEASVRKQLEPYIMRDRCGYHGEDITMVGECSWKIDGIFCYFTAGAGRAKLSFRNGDLWIGKSDLKCEVAFELVGDTLYPLYTYSINGNRLPLSKCVQDYCREQVEFVIMLGGRTLSTTKVQDSLPRDGIVIWGSQRQTYFKFENTVDVTRDMALTLMAEDIVVEGIEDMLPGPIYELVVVNRHLLKPKVTEDNKPVPRDVNSKILPNKMKNVRGAMAAPTVTDVKEYHSTQAHGKACPVCAFLL